MNIELSTQQNEAYTKVLEWRDRQDKPVFRLDGAAGTGKTTLARLLGSGSNVLYAAPTGKAAAVLSSKGCPATTIHQLIYQPLEAGKEKLQELKKEERDIIQQLEEAVGPVETIQEELRVVRDKIRAEEKALSRPFFALKTESDLRDADLLVVDERSMIDGEVGADLLSFNTPILALGDPFQLPPVNGAGWLSEMEAPDYLLTEIHRQALGSPILELATDVRSGRQLRTGYDKTTDAGSACVITRKPTVEEVLEADQLLCGRNATRVALNRRSREARGFGSALPETGDRLVCLRNNHDLGLMNGTIWIVEKNHGSFSTGKIVLDVRSEDGKLLEGVVAHSAPFLGRNVERWEIRDADMFDYGYALTVHKSQGSQWDNVMLFDDWDKRDRRQWLYTGITRAAKRLVICQ